MPVWAEGSSDRVGVVRSKSMQVSQLTQATLDVGHVDLHVVLEATGEKKKDRQARTPKLSTLLMDTVTPPL